MSKAKSWRCFHCDQVFTDVEAARFHFGTTECTTPFCQIPESEVREMERQLDSYRNEDTDLHRQIHTMQSGHQDALRRAEELGYSKGLNDGKLMSFDIPAEAKHFFRDGDLRGVTKADWSVEDWRIFYECICFALYRIDRNHSKSPAQLDYQI